MKSLNNIDKVYIIAFYFSKFSDEAEDNIGYSLNELTSIFRIELKYLCDEFSLYIKSGCNINDDNVREIVKNSYEVLKEIDVEVLEKEIGRIIETQLEEMDEVNNDQDGEISDYNPKNFKFETPNFSIYELYRKYRNKKLVLTPEFQRANVWKDEQKSELIESIVMGLPLPVLYFSQIDSEMKVVDGKQRLSALFGFMENEFVLKGLKLLGNLNGKKFSDLSEVTKTLIEDYQLHVNMIVPPTPDKVLFNIFDRVNRCGTKLNRQEIRNALYPGPGMEMIKRIAKSTEMKDATGGASKNDYRMKIEYLISRFLAFNFVNQKELPYSNSDVDELLKNTYLKINKYKEQQLLQMEDMIKQALRNCLFYIGNNAFLKPDFDGNGEVVITNKKVSISTINMNIFETFMIFMSDMPAEKAEQKDLIFNIVKKYFYNAHFMDSIGNRRDSFNKVAWRLSLINKAKEEYRNAG